LPSLIGRAWRDELFPIFRGAIAKFWQLLIQRKITIDKWP
jgi:hypothetical protein